MTNIDFVTRIVTLMFAITIVLSIFCVICIILLSLSIIFGTRYLKKRDALFNDIYAYYSKNNQIINQMKIDETLENDTKTTKEIIDNCHKMQNLFNKVKQMDLKYDRVNKMLTCVLSIFSFGYIKP